MPHRKGREQNRTAVELNIRKGITNASSVWNITGLNAV
jgi:hypothetical protein